MVLVNARHIKHVPGRKTDVCDSELLCKLLRNGLVKGSFVPERDMRELRDLTRYRKNWSKRERDNRGASERGINTRRDDLPCPWQTKKEEGRSERGIGW